MFKWLKKLFSKKEKAIEAAEKEDGLMEANGFFIWERGLSCPLSSHFKTTEFTCKCGECSLQMVSKKLIAKLELLRTISGVPMYVTSGYRCNNHQANLKLSGIQTTNGVSAHCLGIAADFSMIMGKRCAIANHIEDARKLFKAVGVGRYFMHVDLRSDKERDWVYKA